MTATIEIAHADARARIFLRGAELKARRVGADDLLWPGDPASWPDTAPLLFPVVGWTRDGIRVDAKRYPLGLHGFARTETFRVAALAPDRVTLALSANAHTQTLFPFRFNLSMDYRITTNGLRCVLHVKNEDARPMPYAVGLHPGFRWPLPGATGPHAIDFEAEESANIPVIAPGGLFAAETRAIPLQGRRLALTPDLFSEALCFLDAASRSLEFSSGDSRLRMEVENLASSRALDDPRRKIPLPGSLDRPRRPRRLRRRSVRKTVDARARAQRNRAPRRDIFLAPES